MHCITGKDILDRLEGKWTGFVQNIDRTGKNFVGNPGRTTGKGEMVRISLLARHCYAA